jgi:hypothetical protein
MAILSPSANILEEVIKITNGEIRYSFDSTARQLTVYSGAGPSAVSPIDGTHPQGKEGKQLDLLIQVLAVVAYTLAIVYYTTQIWRTRKSDKDRE